MSAINNVIIGMLVRWQNLVESGKDEDGQTVIEYGLVLALISIVAVAVMATVGGKVVTLFTSASTKLHS